MVIFLLSSTNCSKTGWSLLGALCFLGGNVTPRGTFFKRKLGLLLSLVGGRMMVSLVVIMVCMCWQLGQMTSSLLV